MILIPIDPYRAAVIGIHRVAVCDSQQIAFARCDQPTGRSGPRTGARAGLVNAADCTRLMYSSQPLTLRRNLVVQLAARSLFRQMPWVNSA